MSGLKGNISYLRSLERSIRELPRVIGHKVAAAAAAEITAMARATFNAGRNAYGDKWDPGADGRPVTLKKSGRLAAGVSYVAIGTRLRSRLGPAYAKYQVGKRPVLPRGKLPVSYDAALKKRANQVIAAELGRVK
jgi:hypothetical protein